MNPEGLHFLAGVFFASVPTLLVGFAARDLYDSWRDRSRKRKRSTPWRG